MNDRRQLALCVLLVVTALAACSKAMDPSRDGIPATPVIDPAVTPAHFSGAVYRILHETGNTPGGGYADDYAVSLGVGSTSTGNAMILIGAETPVYMVTMGGAYDSISFRSLSVGDQVDVWVPLDGIGCCDLNSSAPGAPGFEPEQVIVTSHGSVHVTDATPVVNTNVYAGSWHSFAVTIPGSGTLSANNVAIDSIGLGLALPDSMHAVWTFMTETREFTGFMMREGQSQLEFVFFGTCATDNNSCYATGAGGATLTATR